MKNKIIMKKLFIYLDEKTYVEAFDAYHRWCESTSKLIVINKKLFKSGIENFETEIFVFLMKE